MTIGIIAEKPSAARAFAKALGGAKGSFRGEDFVITSLRGHLYEFKDPSKMVPSDQESQYKNWTLDTLPWSHEVFSWEREPRDGAKDVIAQVRRDLSGVDEIAIATDVDPSGEGGLLAAEVLFELGLDRKKLTRLYFTDEAPASLQKAFVSRKPIADLRTFDEFLMADTRSKWDLLSVQFTRVATLASGQRTVLRQGRLKSAMVVLVGDGLKAYNEWKKVPFFQNRFKDENGVVYTDPDEPQFAKKEDVPNQYSSSKVVLDGREMKRTAPPRLLDLAGMSSRLSGKGIKADEVLKTYQKMYEAQVVSYPRTEDKVITPEQFNELLPKIDQIARVVGADVSKLTHRTPRPTHVKTGGAHGANRPGPQVPGSLDELAGKFGPAAPHIYEMLAKNYLSMLAEDYVYERQVGHVEKYPKFKGSANVPKDLGWKSVFSTDDDDADENENTKGLGTVADPFVHEGAPARPPHPTMKWLMTQLEKYDVGTGATRTSIYADVTNARSKAPLLKEARGKITMAEAGEMSYHMLKGTKIADLTITERLMAQMKDVGRGKLAAGPILAEVAAMVESDIVTMKANAPTMHSALGTTPVGPPKPKATGTWKGKEVSFAKSWGGHDFTDAEIARLLAGEEIEVYNIVSPKTGNPYSVKGRLAEQTYKGKKYVGFESTGFINAPGVPDVFLRHKFTAAEKKKLEDGETIKVDDLWSSRKNKKFGANLSYGYKNAGDKDKTIIMTF